MTEPICCFCEALASNTRRLIASSKNPDMRICDQCVLMCTAALFQCIEPKKFVGKPKLVREEF